MFYKSFSRTSSWTPSWFRLFFFQYRQEIIEIAIQEEGPRQWHHHLAKTELAQAFQSWTRGWSGRQRITEGWRTGRGPASRWQYKTCSTNYGLILRTCTHEQVEWSQQEPVPRELPNGRSDARGNTGPLIEKEPWGKPSWGWGGWPSGWRWTPKLKHRDRPEGRAPSQRDQPIGRACVWKWRGECTAAFDLRALGSCSLAWCYFRQPVGVTRPAVAQD